MGFLKIVTSLKFGNMIFLSSLYWKTMWFVNIFALPVISLPRSTYFDRNGFGQLNLMSVNGKAISKLFKSAKRFKMLVTVLLPVLCVFRKAILLLV